MKEKNEIPSVPSIQSSKNLRTPSSSSSKLTVADAMKLVDRLYEKVSASLTYTSLLDKTTNRFDRMANSEIHILYKLEKFLTKAKEFARTSPGGEKDILALIHHGYQCSSKDRTQQEAIARIIAMDICSEVEWYKGAP
jgi:hypothetical protein